MHSDILEAAAFLAKGGDLEGHDLEAPDLETWCGHLYSWYLNSTPVPPVAGPLMPFEVDAAAALRTAHALHTTFDQRWIAEHVSSLGRVVARRGDDTRLLDRTQYVLASGASGRPQPGDAILTSRAWDWVDVETGYWHLRDGSWPPRCANHLVRTYWNCGPRDAVAVVRELTTALVRTETEFVLKTSSASVTSGRADAVVLYIGDRFFPRFCGEIEACAQQLAGVLREPTPRWTRRLAPGVGLAEGAIDGASFGEQRSMTLAAAYLGAPGDVRSTPGLLAEWLARALRDAGVDPDRPYLQPTPAHAHEE